MILSKKQLILFWMTAGIPLFMIGLAFPVATAPLFFAWIAIPVSASSFTTSAVSIYTTRLKDTLKYHFLGEGRYYSWNFLFSPSLLKNFKEIKETKTEKGINKSFKENSITFKVTIKINQELSRYIADEAGWLFKKAQKEISIVDPVVCLSDILKSIQDYYSLYASLDISSLMYLEGEKLYTGAGVKAYEGISCRYSYEVTEIECA